MLDDVKVLDATQVVSGSFASMQLADLGAEVVKVERAGVGDIGRSNPPNVSGTSAYFASVNRNKKSVALDLKSAEGSQAFLDLAEKADVIVENYRPGTMERFGLDYDSVHEVNPGIVYCSISGFGQSGPYAEYPALDIVAQAMSGNMSITGPSDGQPYRAGIPAADIAGSMYAAQSVISALYHRERTGEGQHIDVSMTDGMISWLTVRAGWSLATGDPYPRMGNQLDEFIPYGAFECQDGYLALAAVQDHHWDRLCAAIDRPELVDDERFATVEARREHREELNDVIESAFKKKPVQSWFADLADRNVPVAPVYDTIELWEDEHVQARNLKTTVETPDGDIEVVRHPAKFSDDPAEIERGVAGLGEHTREQLANAGYTDEQIDRLVAEGVADE